MLVSEFVDAKGIFTVYTSPRHLKPFSLTIRPLALRAHWCTERQGGTLVILRRSSFGRKHVACHLGLDAEKKGRGSSPVTGCIAVQLRGIKPRLLKRLQESSGNGACLCWRSVASGSLTIRTQEQKGEARCVASAAVGRSRPSQRGNPLQRSCATSPRRRMEWLCGDP
jgi:hypothetical protein